MAWGWLQDLVKELPLSSVLRERVALAEQQYEQAKKEIEVLKQRVVTLEQENAALRAPLPSKQELSEDTTRVLVHMFRTPKLEERDVGYMARALDMKRSVMQYQRDRLFEAGFAERSGGNYKLGHVYWALTPDGRRYVVERRL